MSLLRPVRNNNPLDIEAGGSWLGLMDPDQMTPAQAAEPRFAVFKAPVWGFRAGAMLLRNYQRNYGLRTIDQLVWRWAPPNENDSKSYAAEVAKLTGFATYHVLNLEQAKFLSPLTKAFATQECGGWSAYWTDEQLAQAISLVHAIDEPDTSPQPTGDLA